ncbi:MAG: DNA-binding response regulator [Proteobacteria bacterium]|nr:MAG: DNA-binding response regulator [Pseudomonadota bacterium]
MDTRRILIVEDDDRISRFLEKGLADAGYRATSCGDAECAQRRLAADPYDLLVLDLMLPGMTGIELCRTIRGQGRDIPILMLTARDSVQDRVAGLRTGGDDYLTKPFAFDELLARIEALLRRGALRDEAGNVLELDDLKLDLDAMQATRGGRTLNLTPKEFRLLELLLRNRGKVCTRATILENVWNLQDDPSTNVVDVYISHLRQKVDHAGGPLLIHTVRGFGYKAERP